MDPTSGNAPRLRRKELFLSVGYDPHEGQIAVHRSRASRRIVCAGTRWGKSTCSAHEAFAALLEPRERTDGWIVSPTYQLSSRVFEQVVDAFRRAMPRRIIEHYERDQILRVINLAGGVSELRGKSSDRPANLLGAGLDFAILDEAALMPPAIWETYVAQRLLDRDGWALFISTPRPCPWLRRLYRRGQVGRDPNVQSWSAPSWQNPHLDRRVIEEQRSTMSEEAWTQEILGEFAETGPEPCSTCSWPNPMAVSMAIFLHGEERPIPTCPDCGLYVDENGRTITGCDRVGKPHFTIITGHERPEIAPSMPCEA
jgi:hypothetical protein